MRETIMLAVAAAALLGSPGPGIAALLAVGRASGLARGLPYLAAMQTGLALAAGLTAAGLTTLLTSVPGLQAVLSILFVAYLVWLAWSIATAPVEDAPGGTADASRFALSGAFLLGFANPKAYLAFAALFGSFSVTEPAHGWHDSLLKWAVIVTVTIVVDLIWLGAGAALRRLNLTASRQRAVNRTLGAMVLVAALASLA